MVGFVVGLTIGLAVEGAAGREAGREEVPQPAGVHECDFELPGAEGF